MRAFYLNQIFVSYLIFLLGQDIAISIDYCRLIDTESKLIDLLQKYAEAEYSRLNKFQKFKDTLAKNINFYATKEEFAGNPLAIFKTIKHLTADFENVEQDMKQNSYADIERKIQKEKNTRLPNEDHFKKEIRNLVRVQKVHNLTVASMMEGRLPKNKTVEALLEAKDCFYIGINCAEVYDYESAVQWLEECLPKFDKFILDKACRILIRSALFLNKMALTRKILAELIPKDISSPALLDLDLTLDAAPINQTDEIDRNDLKESLRLCKDDYGNPITNLKCRYNHHNSPFLTIAPLKEEMLSLAPKVSIFREAVSNSEMEKLKAMAASKYRIATVFQEGNRVADRSYRPCETHFLRNSSHHFINLEMRLQDMTAQSLRYGESFQMINYAPGGFYRVHSDFLKNGTVKDPRQGNRVSSALLYLNDVTSGGNTVFPRLKLSVQPVKGSVLFWMNMKVHGDEEDQTKHAACPVVYGEKIACTQWLRIGGQDRWIAEPEDDARATFRSNPYMCSSRTTA